MNGINNNNNSKMYPDLSSPTPTANPFINGGDLFGMGSFESAPSGQANGKQNGFASGFNKPNFSLDDLDPLKNWIVNKRILKGVNFIKLS